MARSARSHQYDGPAAEILEEVCDPIPTWLPEGVGRGEKVNRVTMLAQDSTPVRVTLGGAD